MDRSAINRKSLKKNFLKDIVIRLDFQGVLQAEMEKILLEVKPYLKSKCFNRYNEKVHNQIVNEGLNIKDVKSQVVYSFVSEALGYTLELSTSFISLTIKTQGYSSFDEYAEIFGKVASTFREKIDFFTCTRFGLRKINVCFVKTKEIIKQYFSSDYYNCTVPDPGLETLSNERKACLVRDAKRVNISYAIDQGQLGDMPMYKVSLDTDVYLVDEVEIEKLLFTEKTLPEINELMFKIYIGAITDNMIELLMNEDVPEGLEIIGVESNE